MLHELTQAQLAALSIHAKRPLIICDVDEVILHFTKGFEDFLLSKGFVLEMTDLRHLQHSVKSLGGGAPLGEDEALALCDQFFVERTRTMQPVNGALNALKRLATQADIVLLTNLPHWAGDDRRHNLAQLGLSYPVITNSGPKGPTIRLMAQKTDAAVIFIDDSPGFIASAHEYAPHVKLVHFVIDAEVTREERSFDFVDLFTHDWDEITAFILPLISV